MGQRQPANGWDNWQQSAKSAALIFKQTERASSETVAAKKGRDEGRGFVGKSLFQKQETLKGKIMSDKFERNLGAFLSNNAIWLALPPLSAAICFILWLISQLI